MNEGGLAWLLSALQTSYKNDDYKAIRQGFKALNVLMWHKEPIVGILMQELDYSQAVLQLVRQLAHKSQEKEVGSLGDAVQCGFECIKMWTHNAKTMENLTEDYLEFAHRVIEFVLGKPSNMTSDNTIVNSLEVLQLLCMKSLSRTMKVVEWKNTELL